MHELLNLLKEKTNLKNVFLYQENGYLQKKLLKVEFVNDVYSLFSIDFYTNKKTKEFSFNQLPIFIKDSEIAINELNRRIFSLLFNMFLIEIKNVNKYSLNENNKSLKINKNELLISIPIVFEDGLISNFIEQDLNNMKKDILLNNGLQKQKCVYATFNFSLINFHNYNLRLENLLKFYPVNQKLIYVNFDKVLKEEICFVTDITDFCIEAPEFIIKDYLIVDDELCVLTNIEDLLINIENLFKYFIFKEYNLYEKNYLIPKIIKKQELILLEFGENKFKDEINPLPLKNNILDISDVFNEDYLINELFSNKQINLFITNKNIFYDSCFVFETHSIQINLLDTAFKIEDSQCCIKRNSLKFNHSMKHRKSSIESTIKLNQVENYLNNLKRINYLTLTDQEYFECKIFKEI
ncbi:MAG: hypothetical protein K2P52_08605 [Campylobacterales bacterium]|nr:hypothetical protein [Campylobacterales bacterium]